MKIHKTFGLDLGTTNSTASVFVNGSNICAEDAKQKTIPSIVAVKGDSFVVGASAKNNVNLERVKSIKRLMGKDERVCLAGKDYKPEEISAEIIKYCADFQPINTKQDLMEEMAYLMKYIEKSKEKIVYSKGLYQYFVSDILEEDVVSTIGQEDKKLLLFDDFRCWDEGELIGKVSSEVIGQMKKCN